MADMNRCVFKTGESLASPTRRRACPLRLGSGLQNYSIRVL